MIITITKITYPTISQMVYQHRRAFFARVLGIYAFKFASLPSVINIRKEK